MSVYRHGETGVTVLMGLESTPGQEAASITRNLGFVNSYNLRTGFEPIHGKSAMSQNRVYSKAGRKFATLGVPNLEVQNWWFLYPFFGSEVYQADTPTASYNTHTLTENNRLPSYSAECIDEDLGVSKKAFGLKGNDFSIKFPDAGPINADLNFVGMDFGKDATPQTPTELATDPWLFDHMTVFTQDGNSKHDVNVDLTWNFNRNVEARTGKGSKIPTFVKEGPRVHELVVDQYQNDMDVYDIVANETEFITVLNCVRAANQDQLALTFNQCRAFEHPSDRGGDDALHERFSIFPFAGSGDTMLSLAIIDQLTAYAT